MSLSSSSQLSPEVNDAHTWRYKESSHGEISSCWAFGHHAARPSTACARAHTHCFILSPYVLSPLVAIISGGMLTEPNWHQRGDGGEHKGSADTDWDQETGWAQEVDGRLIWQALALWHVSKNRDWKHQNRGNWDAEKQRKMTGAGESF